MLNLHHVICVPPNYTSYESEYLHAILGKIASKRTRLLNRVGSPLSQKDFKYHQMMAVEEETWFDPSLTINDIQPLLDIEGKQFVLALPSNDPYFASANLPAPWFDRAGFSAFQLPR